MSHKESRVIMKINIHKTWMGSLSNHQDIIHQLSREGQSIIFRLRIGFHLFKTFNLGDTDKCPCSMALETIEHVFQTCSMYNDFRVANWLALTAPICTAVLRI